MKIVIGIVGLILIAAWVEQLVALRARKRKDSDDGPNGDY